MLEVIKRIALSTIEDSKPVEIIYGEVTQSSPLTVSIEQRLELDEDFLIVPESLTRYEIDLKHTHTIPGGTETQEALTTKIVIRKGLEIGDTVILLRAQGGQEFIILDKVVKP